MTGRTFYMVSRDGAAVAAYLTESQRFGAMLHVHASTSVEWACTYEGWELSEVTAEPWRDGENYGRTVAGMARDSARQLADHGHAWRFESREDRELTRENCGACCLAGYGVKDRDARRSGPNYAGWARVYVQASRPIPIGWTSPFWRELAGAPVPWPDGDGMSEPNARYGDGLRRDVATFGVRFVTPDGTSVDGSEVRR